MSLNDHLLVWPTVHPSLIDVLLQFRKFKVALTTDMCHMYRAIRLPNNQKDLHRFMWRLDPKQPIVEYCTTRLTFGVSASSYAAYMSLKQNILNHSKSHPQAAQAALKSFYIDDGLLGVDSDHEAIQ